MVLAQLRSVVGLTGVKSEAQRNRKRPRDDTPAIPPTKRPIPITNSFATRGAGSTGSARNFLPFWTPSVAELSKKLPLPTATDWHESEWNSWNGCSSATVQNSWFSATLSTPKQKRTNYVTTYSPSSLSSWLATTEGGPPQIEKDADPSLPPPTKKAKIVKDPKPSAGKVRKIRVYPNKQQKTILGQWFGTARWIYNQCVSKVKELRTKKALRTEIVNNGNFKTENTWALDVPYEVRDAAMVDLCNARNSNFVKKKKNPAHTFDIKYRSRKAPQEAIMIRSYSFKKGVFYPKFWGKEPLRSSEPLPDTVDYDCRLVRTRLNQYYLCIPMPLEMASDNQARQPKRIVALDPGVRTFHTAYDPSGAVMEFGKGDMKRIKRICDHMDNLQSRLASNKNLRHKQRYRMRRAWRKMQWRIRNLVDECHKKIVKFLCANYSVILLPSFPTQQMVGRNKRKIGRKTARKMVTWSHYRFKQRLLFKQQEYPWCKVVICNEAYTSITCGRCGRLHHNLGDDNIFQCPSCGLEADRDAQAARNILLKNMTFLDLRVEETLGLHPSSL